MALNAESVPIRWLASPLDIARHERAKGASAETAACTRRTIRRSLVRRENVDRRPTGPPRIQHLRQRPAARIAARHILAGLVLSLTQPGVHEHRQRIFGFTGRRDMAHVTAVVPCHE